MKAIVTSWIYPHEQENNSDDRPNSIERISTSSQCNLLVTKNTGEQLQGISLEFIRE